MATLTALEDRLCDVNAQAEIDLIIQVRARLEFALMKPMSREEYKELTLLLEAVVQAEDIIKVIYFRYHNVAINNH